MTVHLADWMEKVDLAEEIQEVYLHRFIFKLAVGLVSIFLPLYILDLGYSNISVIYFFLAYYLAFIIASFPNGIISSKLGFKHTSLLSSPLILAFYLLLRQNPAGNAIFYIAVLGGYAFNLYWLGMNPETAESTDSDKREEETGIFFSMPTLASMIAPSIGGLILAVYTFEALFLFATVLIATSFLPFLFSREHHEGMEVDPLSFFKKDHLSDFITYAGKGAAFIGKKVLWPLYLAVIIQETTSIGGAGSLLALGSAVTGITLGKITDKDNRDLVIIAGCVITAATYLIMSQLTNPIHAMIISFVNGLGLTTMSLPIYSRAMDRAEEEDYIEYFAFREVALSIGRVITLLTIAAIFKVTASFTPSFILLASSLIITGYFGRKVS